MTGFLIRRVLQALLVVFLVTVFTLALVHLFPGGPIRCAARPPGDYPEQVAHYNQLYGFDQPFYVQYIKWVGQLLHGNLGFSAKLNQSVTSLLAQDLPIRSSWSPSASWSRCCSASRWASTRP